MSSKAKDNLNAASNSSSTNGLSASQEDYLEAIYNLTIENDVARSKDIARVLNVAKPSVTGALRTLSEKKLVNYKPYGYVTLTQAGRQQAKAVADKHEIIKSFFVDILGVENTTAGDAACKAEHALGPQIVDRLLAFSEFVTDNSEDLAKKFNTYWKKHSNDNTLQGKN
jgi:DtxR family Mn-dependent transcriptional regulator